LYYIFIYFKYSFIQSIYLKYLCPLISFTPIFINRKYTILEIPKPSAQFLLKQVFNDTLYVFIKVLREGDLAFQNVLINSHRFICIEWINSHMQFIDEYS
jgi:hypothetical protein